MFRFDGCGATNCFQLFPALQRAVAAPASAREALGLVAGEPRVQPQTERGWTG
jgi:hypothetical protein